jgi:hypothetical protein
MTELLSPSLYIELLEPKTLKGTFLYPRTKYYYKESRKNRESYSTSLKDGKCKSFPSVNIGSYSNITQSGRIVRTYRSSFPDNGAQ